MENSKLAASPIDAGKKLNKATTNSELFNQVAFNQELGRQPDMLARTQPDMSYAVGNVARFCSWPTEQHWKIVKHI